MEPLNFRYRFRFADANVLDYVVELAAESLQSGAPDELPPSWAALDYHQCPNCPWDVAQVPHCPVAVRLAPLLPSFGRMRSYDPTDVEVTLPGDRILSARASLQQAASSLLGLLMATSGCPHTLFLKPMARFHLPLADETETLYRAAGTFLLAMYFRHVGGRTAAFDFAELAERYGRLQVVNLALTQRLKAASKEDGAINAVVLLDILAKSVPWSIEDNLDSLHGLFADYGI